MHAIGHRAGAAPKYERLTRTEKLSEIQRLLGNGLTSLEAHRVVGLYRPQTASPPPLHTPMPTMSRKANRRAEKHRKEVACYYNALTRPELRGLKGVRK